ncbi:MAG TPA: alkaline phosphatase D family protein [Solirubrobacteraceae bacterium]|nr:alkaline phosphatase D family protein [Solirubrobacteraceae bacterium]
MADLVLGPAVRYVSDTEANVWLEADGPCEAAILDHRASTFCVNGHHYALVEIHGLEPGRSHPYDVRLDGERVWPPPDDQFPPCAIRTLPAAGPLRVAFGSCRVSVPHEEPYTLRKDEDSRGREIDALFALVARMRRQPDEEWPHVMLLLGDQVYADEVSPATLDFVRSRRDVGRPPGEEVADYEEYTRLYSESWLDPAMRWFLSTAPTSMIWDDHDVHDDWNTSLSWLEAMRAKPWWETRIAGAIATYWIYQHLGNLSPRELAQDELWQRVRDSDDAGDLLREFALQADRETEGTRWSFFRDLGRTRLVMMDSRAGRVLTPERRSMVDDDEWRWIVEHSLGDFDHLLLGTSLPVFLSRSMHHMEAWNEAVCEGAWGARAARLGERLRQGLDFEHWAAFGASFRDLCGLIQAAAVGGDGSAPASIVALSGDVHHAYLAEIGFPPGSGARSAVYQAVCSPVRNPLEAREKRAIRAAMSRPAGIVARTLARAAGVDDPPLGWRMCGGPWFDNQIATLEIDGRSMVMRLERALPGEEGQQPERELETVLERPAGLTVRATAGSRRAPSPNPPAPLGHR